MYIFNFFFGVCVCVYIFISRSVGFSSLNGAERFSSVTPVSPLLKNHHLT